MAHMYKIKLLLVIVGLITLSGGIAIGEDWQVGEKWIYKHEGPRPYADPSAVVKGDRTAEVIAIKGEGAEKQYLLKNMWGSEDPNPSTSYIDSKNMLHKIDIEFMFTLLITPPVPIFWGLKPGEEKTLKTNLDLAGMSIPIEYVAKRMKDETITVPAGTFENCRHVQIISSLQNENGQTMKNKEEYWFHPKVRNLVKGVIITNYQGDGSYTSTSLLKSHTKKN